MFASPRSELLALLAAIKSEPEENTPKLALADWLQEQPDAADQARGEFLHRFVQNNLLARTDPKRQDFGALIRLWNDHETAWIGTLRSAGFTVWATNHMFRWGLLFPALDGTQAGMIYAPRVAHTEEYAWVSGISFRAVDPDYSPLLADSPLLDSLIALRISGSDGRRPLIERLCESPRAARLQYLDIGGMGGGSTPLATVARSPHFGSLRHLILKQITFSGPDLYFLTASRLLNSLRVLDLSGCRLADTSADPLADGTGLPNLVELNLGPDGYYSNQLGDNGMIRIVANPHTGRLRKLNLASNDIGGAGVQALCAQSHMCNLTHLNLSDNRIPSRIAGELAEAEHLKTLEELNLSACAITNDGATALARSPHLNSIRRLDLTQNRIGPRAAKALRDRFGTAVVLNT